MGKESWKTEHAYSITGRTQVLQSVNKARLGWILSRFNRQRKHNLVETFFAMSEM